MAAMAGTRVPGPAADEAWIEHCCGSDCGGSPVHLDLYRSFQWHDRFLVGHPDIDADHKRFFAYFTDMARRVDGRGDSQAISALFLEVVDDLRRHLVDEERILEQVGSTLLAEHRSSHRALAGQADAALAIGADGEWATALRLLSMAVLEHIVLEDAKFRPCLSRAAAIHQSLGQPPLRW